MQTLLITGAAGIVGTALRPYLRQHYKLRLLDRLPVADLQDGESEVVGDLTDPVFVERAMAGCNAVLHLACAHGTGIAFGTTVEPNYHATLYLLEAAQRHGVKRFIFTSSHHVVGQYRTDFAKTFDDLPPAPDSYYALSKVFGEAACAAWSLRYNLSTFVIRIGNADPQVSDARRLRLWTSARDLAQLTRIGLEHPQVKHEIVYGVSECPDALFTNARARALGYAPQDNAAEHLSPEFQPYESMDPARSGRDFVGGSYAGATLASLLEPQA
jgi:uronate dehydrogenase